MRMIAGDSKVTKCSCSKGGCLTFTHSIRPLSTLHTLQMGARGMLAVERLSIGSAIRNVAT